MSRLDIVGVSEFAELAGTTRIMIATWHRRGHLPTPDAVLACGPIWRRATAQRWIDGAGKQRVALIQKLGAAA